MRKKAAITTGVAAAVLGGGLALALNGGGASAAGTTAAVAPARPTGSPAVTKISRSEAEQIALAAVPGGRVTSAELESEHGAPVWSVRVTDGGVRHDLDINAYTGKVIRDRDDDARPARPAAPEPRHDRAREAEHRHGEAEPRDDHGREAEPGDDHGRHGEAEDHHGGGDDGHRGRGH